MNLKYELSYKVSGMNTTDEEFKVRYKLLKINDEEFNKLSSIDELIDKIFKTRKGE
jgi:hypothetical protein